MSYILSQNAGVRSIVQERTLERAFHDALFPALLYRADVDYEEAGGNIGDSRTFTKSGLLTPVTTPLTPGADPVPQTLNFEQWSASLQQYAGGIDTHMPTSSTALASLFLRNGKQLGMQAGQSINRLARNALFLKYTQGHTTTDTGAAAGASTIHVRSLNGFRFVSDPANGVLEPAAVSAGNPLVAAFDQAVVPFTNHSITAAVPDDPADPNGPGTLTITGTFGGAGVAADAAINASNAPFELIAGGGSSPLAITAADVLTLALIRKAVARLRTVNVPAHSDGDYHAHTSPNGESQVFDDNEWQRLHQSLPDEVAYRELAIGKAVNTTHYRNTETPSQLTVPVGDPLQHIGAGKVSGVPLVSSDGTPITATIVTGYGSMYEFFLDEAMRFVTEAGLTGKQGVFDIANNAIQIVTDRIRFILRAPVDRLQQIVAQSWSWSGDFPIPSDILTGGPALFKRAVVIFHADA